MKKVLVACFACIGLAMFGQSVNSSDLVIGKKYTIHSNILDEDRVINVYFPVHYELEEDRSFPIVYLLDGGLEEDFLHIAGLTQFLSFSWVDRMPEAIVIGIENVDRKRDFTFPSDEPEDLEMLPSSGGSEQFRAFLESELMPFVQSQFRTDGRTTLIGQSLGGLLASEILIKQPDLFDDYIIVSPSLWWDAQSIFVWNMQEPKNPHRVFLSVGEEGDMMVKPARSLYESLLYNNSGGMRIQFEHYPLLNHGDALHRSVYEGMEWIYRMK